MLPTVTTKQMMLMVSYKMTTSLEKLLLPCDAERAVAGGTLLVKDSRWTPLNQKQSIPVSKESADKCEDEKDAFLMDRVSELVVKGEWRS